MKTYILHPTPTPYRFELFRELSQLLDHNLRIVFLSSSADNRPWKDIERYGFSSNVVSGIKFGFGLNDWNEVNFNPKLIKRLFSLKNEDILIVSGWLDLTIQLVVLLKPVIGYKLIIWSGSTDNEKSFLRTITLPYTKLLIKLADYYIAIGTRSKKYLQKLGAPIEKIQIAYNTINTEQFSRYSDNQYIDKLRDKLGLEPDWKYVLYVGQFIKRKNVKRLLQAIKRAQGAGRQIGLILQGYGPLKNEYEKIAHEKNLHQVKFSNHIPYEHMPAIYNLGDLLVLPSKTEVWGLVVNEAMIAGLPVVVSEKCGSAQDLVVNNKNGFIFDPEDPEDLVKKIITSLDNQKAMSRRSKKMIQKFTAQEAALAFEKAINELR